MAHHQTLRVEQVVHAPALQGDHWAHETNHQIRPGVRLEWLVVDHRDWGHQLLHDRTGHILRVELRLAPLLVVWHPQCLAVPIYQE